MMWLKWVSSAALAHAVLVGALLFAGGIAVGSIGRALYNREALVILVGNWFPALLGLACLSAVALAAALAARVRAWQRRAPPPFMSLRAVFDLAVLATAIYLTFFQPFQRIQFELYVGVAAGSLAIWTLAESRIVRSVRSGLLRAIDMLLFSVCLLALSAEVGLRAWATLRPSALFTRTSQSAAQLMEGLRRPPGEIHLGFPYNSRGHYDEEFRAKSPAAPATATFNGERLVVVIGDSFSLSLVPHHYHYTTVCERVLPGTRVDNMGIAAVGPREYLLMMCQEALPLAPDLVVIGLFVGNDVSFFGYQDVPTEGILRSWFDRDAVYLCLLPKRLARLARERRAIGDGDRTIGGVGGERAASAGRIDDLDELERLLPWLHKPELEQPGFTRERFLAIEQGRALSICAGGSEEYAPLFRELEKIVDAAGSTPLAFLLIPDEFQVDDQVWADVVAGLPESELERDRAQRLIRDWLDARAVPCLDLLPRMRALEENAKGAHFYLKQNTHWSVRGNQVAGEALAELVRAVLDEKH